MLFLQRVTNVKNFYAKKYQIKRGGPFIQVPCQVNPFTGWNFLNVGMMSETSRYLVMWILLKVKMMPKILHYLITLKFLLSNVRFLASFRCLEESTKCKMFNLMLLSNLRFSTSFRRLEKSSQSH